jgi:hypothetical protein
MQGRYSTADLAEAKRLTEEAGNDLTARRKIHHSPAMVLGMIQGLRRLVLKLSVPRSTTTWGSYDTDHSYGEKSFQTKEAFVQRIASSKRRSLVWDLGCNTGTFSRILADNSNYVVAADGDASAVERLYEAEKARGGSNICPAVINLSNVSPGQGWHGAERKAFDARSQPELILCLALIHHIVITANIPLAEFVGWLRKFGAEVIIEFVSLDDDMAKMLLRNKKNQYSDLTEKDFEALVSTMFTTVSTETLKRGHRKLYHLVPR